MAIVVSCHCGARLSVKDEHAGKRVRCPKCAQPVSVPAASLPTGPVAPVRPAAPHPAPHARQQPTTPSPEVYVPAPPPLETMPWPAAAPNLPVAPAAAHDWESPYAAPASSLAPAARRTGRAGRGPTPEHWRHLLFCLKFVLVGLATPILFFVGLVAGAVGMVIAKSALPAVLVFGLALVASVVGTVGKLLCLFNSGLRKVQGGVLASFVCDILMVLFVLGMMLYMAVLVLNAQNRFGRTNPSDTLGILLQNVPQILTVISHLGLITYYGQLAGLVKNRFQQTLSLWTGGGMFAGLVTQLVAFATLWFAAMTEHPRKNDQMSVTLGIICVGLMILAWVVQFAALVAFYVLSFVNYFTVQRAANNPP